MAPLARSKTPAYVIAAATLLVICVYVLANRLLIGTFETLEREETLQRTEQVARALAADLRQLEVSTRDYAQWDDAVHYLAGERPSFLDSNFSPTTLDGMQVDVAWMADADGRDVLALARRPGDARAYAPAGDALLATLRPLLPLAFAEGEAGRSRLLRLGELVFAFSARHITHSDGSGGTGATLLFGRYLEADELARIAATSQLPVELLLLDAGRGADAALPAPVRQWLAEGTGTRLVRPRDDARIDGYVRLLDVRDRPIALLATHTARATLAAGRTATWLLSGLLTVVCVAFTVLVVVLLLRLDRDLRARIAGERRYRTVIEQLDEGVLLADAATLEILETNPVVRRWLGPTAPSGTAADVLPNAAETVRTLVAGPQTTIVSEGWLQGGGGLKLAAEVRWKLVSHEGRSLVCCVIRDITARQRFETAERASRRRLAHLAHHDPLTGLPNRLHLHKSLPRMLERATQRRATAAVFYVDLDHFKKSNDVGGHAHGDAVLRAMSRRLRQAVAAGDLVVRTGGDEFVVVAEGAIDAGVAETLAARLNEVVRAPLDIEGGTVRMTASIGISRWPEHGVAAEELLKHADIALYQAKAQGRDRAVSFKAEMTVRLAERIALEQALREAIDDDQLYVEYQPIVTLKTRSLLGFEALARWRHPVLGVVPPTKFIAIAEDSGLVPALGAKILEHVCRQLAQWRADGVPLVPVGVNVSPLQLESEPLSTLVERLTSRYRLDPALLAFEITETALMRDPTRHLEALARVRALGCSLSIDDFGTGYSSLAYLKHLRVDALKIDRAFVRDLAEDANDASIVGAVVSMSESLGMRVVAEGIETVAQQNALIALGCAAGQGYLYSRPLPARHCRAVLDALSVERKLTETVVARTAQRRHA